MTPRICNFHITLQCNDTCEFCQCWQRSGAEHQETRISEDQIRKALKEARIKGAKKLNITGGEPLLNEDLPKILSIAGQLGFEIDLYTNGILYQEKAATISKLANKIFFALDYPIASEHDRSRGLECYNDVISAIKLAKKLGEKPIINFTMTRDSVRFLPEMVDLSEKMGVFVYLNPVYDFAGTQGFEPLTIDQIKYYYRRKSVLANLAALEFVKAKGNNTIFPRCRAKESTVTILPDGNMVQPCYYNQGGEQGRAHVCSSCMRWPYMLPSLSHGFDRYFWLDRYSNWLNSRKEKLT